MIGTAELEDLLDNLERVAEECKKEHQGECCPAVECLKEEITERKKELRRKKEETKENFKGVMNAIKEKIDEHNLTDKLDLSKTHIVAKVIEIYYRVGKIFDPSHVERLTEEEEEKTKTPKLLASRAVFNIWCELQQFLCGKKAHKHKEGGERSWQKEIERELERELYT